MRKYLFVLLAILFVGGVAFSETPGYRQNPGTGDILGQGKYQSDPHRIFRLVRYVPATYAGASALAADSIVIWDATSDDGVTVTTTTTSYDSAVAGIIVTQASTGDTGLLATEAAGDSNWTWLQTYGKSQVNFCTTCGGVSAKSAIATSTTAGEASQFLGSTTSSVAQGKAGFAYDAATPGDDDVEVFLTGLD